MPQFYPLLICCCSTRECRHIHRHSRESGNPKAIGSKCVFASYRIPGSRFRGDDGNRRLETDILKLTTLRHIPTAEDEGKFLKAVIFYHDMHGIVARRPVTPLDARWALRGLEVISSNPVAAAQLQASNTRATGVPGIDGSPVVAQTLTADTSGIDDEDGLTGAVFAYQWISRDPSGRTDEDIEGATGPTYIVAAGDIGEAVRVRVTFHDNGGNAESVTSAPTAAVTAARLELQTAVVDGASLTLTYNATLDNGVMLPTSALAVNVNGASRSLIGVGVGGSSVLLLLSPSVEAGDTVSVDYTVPDGTEVIKDTLGRKANSFSGKEVSNNTASAGTGRSVRDEAPGAPGGLEVARHESGKLRASWDVPDSGPTPTGYTVQWKESGDDWAVSDDVSESTVEGTSYVITSLIDGVKYAVRVIASKDDTESAPSNETTATPWENTPPALASATVDGATLTLTFDEALDAGQMPDTSAIVVTVAGSNRGVDTVAMSDTAVTLALVTAVFSGDAVAVDYEAPTGESGTGLQDLVGNAADSFSEQEVTNVTQAAAQLTASIHSEPASHDGQAEFTFELRFSENLEGFSYRTLRDHAFTVTGGEVQEARRLVRGSNTRWETRINPTSNADVTIVLPITTVCTANGAICTGDGRKLSNRLELTVSGPTSQQSSQQQENTPATGSPTISGTVQVGETLTALTSGISDSDGTTNASYTYQWIANEGTSDSDIADATASTYALVDGDAGKTIKVQVTFTDDAGNEETLTSAATAAVETRPNSPATGAPTISGTVQVKETLTASTSGIADTDGLTNVSYSYQWIRNDGSTDTDIQDATGSGYTLVDADAGKTIKVKVSFTDDAGHEETLATASVEASQHSGTGASDHQRNSAETLTAIALQVSPDTDGLTNVSYSYQWIRSDGSTDTDIQAARSDYTLVDADAGKTIKVQVTFTDDAGNEETITSAATATHRPRARRPSPGPCR